MIERKQNRHSDASFCEVCCGEEALSVDQTSNGQLLTSKEELQSLNEELATLNSQLQETLERQRRIANDLQNILYSTDVATLFLDAELRVKFFTPATKLLFDIISADIGRPLSDLHSLAMDTSLAVDARNVLRTGKPAEREIATRNSRWFLRRILPYRALNHGVEGVVITFTDITERKRIRQTLEVAVRQAEQANLAKSRFLAAASHDLRQPLQTLALLQGLLAKKVQGETAARLVRRLDDTLTSMSTMLNTMLDINLIDSGITAPQIASCGRATGLKGVVLAIENDPQGDISTQTLRDIASCNCTHVSKPVKAANLLEIIQRSLLASSPAASALQPEVFLPDFISETVYIVDDDTGVRDAVCAVLADSGYTVASYSTCEAFLKEFHRHPGACLLIDAYLPGMNGTDLLNLLKDTGQSFPSIMITGNSDVTMAVAAMKAGASDFLEKPIGAPELLASVSRILEQSRDSGKRDAWNETAAARVSGLTARQQEIMHLVLAGHPNKNIAADLGISQRTVETHRATIMRKTGSQSLPALARLALAAAANNAERGKARYSHGNLG